MEGSTTSASDVVTTGTTRSGGTPLERSLHVEVRPTAWAEVTLQWVVVLVVTEPPDIGSRDPPHRYTPAQTAFGPVAGVLHVAGTWSGCALSVGWIVVTLSYHRLPSKQSETRGSGREPRVVAAVELSGGGYNTTYRLELGDDTRAVLRVAPA